MAHRIPIMAIPRIIPNGMANLHQLNASPCTIFMICRGVAPMQHIIPKNSVRCPILLLRLLVIIMSPAKRTSKKRIPAAPYNRFQSFWNCELLFQHIRLRITYPDRAKPQIRSFHHHVVRYDTGINIRQLFPIKRPCPGCIPVAADNGYQRRTIHFFHI